MSTTVVVTTTRAWRLKRLFSSTTSFITTNPMPPRTMRPITVRLTTGSRTNCSRLVLNTENPALQNAEMLWKMAVKIARGNSRYRKKSRKRTRHPTPSTKNVYLMTARTKRTTPPGTSRPKESLSASRSRYSIRRRMAIARTVVIVMYPSPPIWMRTRITSCPQKEKNVAVSTTMSPVTQTAEVAVKHASMKCK